MKLSFKHTRFTCYCAYGVGAVIVNFSPLLFIIFQKEFGLSMLKLSSLIALNFGTQMTVDILGAHFVDKIGYRKCIVAANIFAAVGFTLMGILPFLMPSYLGLIISTVLFSIGGGLLEVLVSPITEALPTEGKEATMSLLHSFYCWGQVATVLLTTVYFAVFGTGAWRILCMLWAVLPIFTAVMFCFVPINSFTNEETKVPIRALFKEKRFVLFLILMLCSGASEIAMAQWASLFAETSLGITKAVGDIFGPCMFAVTMGISRVLYAKCADKLNLANYIIFCAGLCIVSYLLASLSPINVLSMAGCLICGFSVGVMWPGVLSISAEKCPQGGTALFALLAFTGDIGCMTGPSTAGLIAERFSIGGSPLKAGLLGCIIFPLVMILCTFILKRMKEEKVYE